MSRFLGIIKRKIIFLERDKIFSIYLSCRNTQHCETNVSNESTQQNKKRPIALGKSNNLHVTMILLTIWNDHAIILKNYLLCCDNHDDRFLISTFSLICFHDCSRNYCHCQECAQAITFDSFRTVHRNCVNVSFRTSVCFVLNYKNIS